MRPDSSRLDPLAPTALALLLIPFAAGLVTDHVTLPWRLAALGAGGALGVVSLRRIRRAGGRLRGRPLALTAAVAGLGVGAVGMLMLAFVLAFVLAIFVATGSS